MKAVLFVTSAALKHTISLPVLIFPAFIGIVSRYHHPLYPRHHPPPRVHPFASPSRQIARLHAFHPTPSPVSRRSLRATVAAYVRHFEDVSFTACIHCIRSCSAVRHILCAVLSLQRIAQPRSWRLFCGPRPTFSRSLCLSARCNPRNIAHPAGIESQRPHSVPRPECTAPL
jgi:hypothetical protein